ncbi:phage portal protein [Rhodovulum tesquicola]|uniref:phage portal protein n=1 Tax=Rhodovulum tesquicola TaxID=540254 RepID=UPI002097BCAE|nr:phage portal protein [Rhodovulum tesquicola]MCO8144850.1 phage portal protein [Rhodovulum tesquicola]
MGLFDFFRRKPETRAAASGFTAEIIAAREAYISGSRGIAELTATAQTCVSLWESGLALADVDGTDLLDRRTMALAGRAAALRGEAVFLITDEGLVPCSDWDLTTRNGRPRAYRLSIAESGGGRTFTALAAEVLHLRIGCDPAAPYYGTAPLKRAQLTAGLLNAVENALAETFETAPIGSQIVPLPDSAPDDMDNMRAAFRGRRGSVLVVEGVAQATAAGMNPQLGQRREDLTPNIKDAMAIETMQAARDAIGAAFGVLPGLLNRATTGPMVREAQRHLATWQLQPLAELLAEEATQKLGAPVRIDTLRPLQAFDAGGRARALSAIIGAMAQAKEAGIDPDLALKLVDWHEREAP